MAIRCKVISSLLRAREPSVGGSELRKVTSYEQQFYRAIILSDVPKHIHARGWLAQKESVVRHFFTSKSYGRTNYNSALTAVPPYTYGYFKEKMVILKPVNTARSNTDRSKSGMNQVHIGDAYQLDAIRCVTIMRYIAAIADFTGLMYS